MKISWIATAMLILTLGIVGSGQPGDMVHTPAKGSVERKGNSRRIARRPAGRVQGSFFKVHNGWAWLDVTPLDSKGNAIAEGGPNLLHLEDGVWKVLDLTKSRKTQKILLDRKTPVRVSSGI